MWIKPEGREEYYHILDDEHRGSKQWHLTIGVKNLSQIMYLGVRSIQIVTRDAASVSLVRYLRLALQEGKTHLHGGARLGNQARELRLEELADEKNILYSVLLNTGKRNQYYGHFLQEYPKFQQGFEDYRKILESQR